MAAVKLTQDIRSRVLSNIRGLYTPRIEKKLEELQHLDVGEQVFATRVDPEDLRMAKLLNMNMKWVQEMESLTVTVTYAHADGHEVTRTFTVKFKPPVPAPEHMRGWNADNSKNKVLPSMACYPHVVKVFQEIDTMVTERDKLLEAVRGALNKSSSLNALLKVWPTAIDYMPDDVKARHFEKVEPVKRAAPIPVEINDEAKMLLVKARLLHGS